MKIYAKHIFVCENERDINNPLGCCSRKGSQEITKSLKKLCNEAGLKGKVRVNKAGCLGQCERGVVMVVYPEGTWYQKVTQNDVPEIFQEDILNNRAVHRLEICVSDKLV